MRVSKACMESASTWHWGELTIGINPAGVDMDALVKWLACTKGVPVPLCPCSAPAVLLLVHGR